MSDYFEDQQKRKKLDEQSAEAFERSEALFRSDMKSILRSPEVLRVFYDILDFSGVWVSPMKTSSEIYHRTGMADVGRKILSDIQELGPDAYLEIMKLKFEKEKKVKETK
jgi:hypothetical protein